jgi:hypothetical protein
MLDRAGLCKVAQRPCWVAQARSTQKFGAERQAMTDAEDFSHGSYGDYSGVVFYGPPTNGFWLDRLAVSDRYIAPLFAAVLDRSREKSVRRPLN